MTMIFPFIPEFHFYILLGWCLLIPNADTALIRRTQNPFVSFGSPYPDLRLYKRLDKIVLLKYISDGGNPKRPQNQ